MANQDRFNIPPDIPFWATQDEVDPVWGVNNVLIPQDEERIGGFQPGQTVPSNYINYFFRRLYQWVGYLDGFRDRIAVPDGSDTHVITVTGVKPGDSVLATVNQTDSNNNLIITAEVTNNDEVTFTFSGTLGSNPQLILSYMIWSNTQVSGIT